MAYWRGLFDPLILPAQWRCECGVIGCSTISMPSLHECPPARQQRGLFRPAASASAPAARSRTRNLEVNQAPSPASTPSPGGLAEGVRNPGPGFNAAPSLLHRLPPSPPPSCPAHQRHVAAGPPPRRTTAASSLAQGSRHYCEQHRLASCRKMRRSFLAAAGPGARSFDGRDASSQRSSNFLSCVDRLRASRRVKKDERASGHEGKEMTRQFGPLLRVSSS